MPSIDSLRTLLVEELKDIYDAEKRLTKAIPKLVKKSASKDLSAALEAHLSETQAQVKRLEQAFAMLDEAPKGKPCAGMKGIIEEGSEHAGEDYDDDALRDAAIIGSAQRAEHYEMAAYGTAIAHARQLRFQNVADLLEETLSEEKAADQKLSEIAEGLVNVDAASEDGDADRDSRARGNGKTTNGGRSKVDRKNRMMAANSSAKRGKNGRASARR